MSRSQQQADAVASSSGLGQNYYKLWTASAISNLGDGVRITALPLVAASITRDPALVAGVSFASSLPWLLFALIAGAIADRADRRKLMGIVQLYRMGLMVLLTAAIVTGVGDTATLIVLYLVSFLLGIGETLFDNAAQSIMPSIVRREQLQVANGRLYAAELTTNEFAGPPIGSFLFVAAAAAPFVLDAVTFALAALLIFAITGAYRPTATSSEPVRMRAAIAEGLRWLLAHRMLRTLGIMTGVSNLASNVVFATFVLYVLEILGLSESAYGLLLAVGAIGGVLGGLLGPRIARVLGDGPSIHLVILTAAAGNLAVAVLDNVVVVAARHIVFGIGAMTWNVIVVSLRQQIVPDHLMGRVNSVYRLLAWGTIPVGAALGGLLADAFGLRAPWLITAVMMVVLAATTLPIVNNRTIAEARRAQSE